MAAETFELVLDGTSAAVIVVRPGPGEEFAADVGSGFSKLLDKLLPLVRGE